jgi:hypothetical protein
VLTPHTGFEAREPHQVAAHFRVKAYITVTLNSCQSPEA